MIRVVSTPASIASPTSTSADTTPTQAPAQAQPQTPSSRSISFSSTKSVENLNEIPETAQTGIASSITGSSSQRPNPYSLNSTETTLRTAQRSSGSGRAKRIRGILGSRDDSIPQSESLYEPHAVSPSSSTNLLAPQGAHPTPAAEQTESMSSLLPLRYRSPSLPGENANNQSETVETPVPEKRSLDLETFSMANSPVEQASTRDVPETPAPPYPTEDDNGQMSMEFRLSDLEQSNTRAKNMDRNTGSFTHSGMADATDSVLTEEESLITRSVFMARRVASLEKERWVSPPRYAE
ncbi:hypothetical protein PQX77_015572 [Marasmius sp. AFHP31]|nr:hypothetical protein PQX77_015572 [Marasmius sp. AFHP31]